MSKATNIAFLAAGALLAGGVLAFAPISGELDPPVGQVEPTTPSLADLETKIESLAASSSAEDGWSVAFIANRDSTSELDAILIAEGRVLVRRTSVFGGGLTLFDGPGGTVDDNGIPLNDATARYFNFHTTFGDGVNQSPSQLDVSLVFENGLYLGYAAIYGTAAVFQIEYRVLE